jgi:hypothetical protein
MADGHPAAAAGAEAAAAPGTARAAGGRGEGTGQGDAAIAAFASGATLAADAGAPLAGDDAAEPDLPAVVLEVDAGSYAGIWVTR